jgi:hypothetical protein
MPRLFHIDRKFRTSVKSTSGQESSTKLTATRLMGSWRGLGTSTYRLLGFGQLLLEPELNPLEGHMVGYREDHAVIPDEPLQIREGSHHNGI